MLLKKSVITLVIVLIAGAVYVASSLPGDEGKQEEGPVVPCEGEEAREERNAAEPAEEAKGDYDNRYYLGIAGDRIAVYRDRDREEPELVEVLPYPVKDVYYEELKQGIPFSSQEEKIRLLENLSS